MPYIAPKIKDRIFLYVVPIVLSGIVRRQEPEILNALAGVLHNFVPFHERVGSMVSTVMIDAMKLHMRCKRHDEQ